MRIDTIILNNEKRKRTGNSLESLNSSNYCADVVQVFERTQNSDKNMYV